MTAIDPTYSCDAFERTFAEEYAKARDLPAPPPPPPPIQATYEPPPPVAPRALGRTIIIPRRRARPRSAASLALGIGIAAVVCATMIEGATSGRFGRALDLIAAIVDPASSMWH